MHDIKLPAEFENWFEGILYIGDLHLCSDRVGRRIDDYMAAGLDKLEQCAELSRSRKLYPVLLGDLFHKNKESSLPLLHRVMSALAKFPVPPLLVAGSHGRVETRYTEKDATFMIARMGSLHALEDVGHVVTLNVKGQRTRIFVTPAGELLPDAVPVDAESVTVMLTHHDFDFQGPYPGCHMLKPVEGCNMLVNGHMHTPTPSVMQGHMACHNPGSVMRVSIDQRRYEPAVTIWEPSQGLDLVRQALRFNPDVFDLTGKEVYAADDNALKAVMPKVGSLSRFAAKLRSADPMEAARTQDGSVLAEELDAYFKLFEKPAVLRQYMGNLLKEVVEKDA